MSRLSEGAYLRNLVFLWVVLFSYGSLAADIEPIFNALKQSAVNYEPDGAVCEQVARLKFQEEFPNGKFIVSGGVVYSTGQDALGELDVVILDRNSNKVVMIAEVKCWKNLDQAMEKARSQRNRFSLNLSRYPRQLQFTSYDGLQYQVDQFSNVKNFRSISQQGGVGRGFDMELEFTLAELKELRKKLLQCQAWGDCARPQ